MAKNITITLNKKTLLLGVLLVAIIGGIVFSTRAPTGSAQAEDANNDITRVYKTLSPAAQARYYQQSNELTTPVPERLVELDQLSIGCFGSSKVLQMSTSDQNLGGQCCGTLKDIDAYTIQLNTIKAFIDEHRPHLSDDADLIPLDPYEVSVEHAQQLITLDNEIVLTPAQQATYDQAVKMSHHGGPCCCKCWKWYVMSGLAKKLITEYDFTAEETAELWDISSSCGHDEDTEMAQHYQKKTNGNAQHGH